jgi:hypothetical protein
MDATRRRRRGRRLRLALACAGTLLATGLIGYGGLAAWNAYTDNPASVAAQSLGHRNAAPGGTCNAVTSTAQLTYQPASGGCAYLFNLDTAASEVSPDSPSTLGTTTVAITNTGVMPSDFSVGSLRSPVESPSPGTSLCSDLTLTISDTANGTIWTGSADTAVSVTSLRDSAGAVTWPGTSPGLAGSDTYTVSLSKGPNFDADSQDQGSTCSFDLLFTQVNA